MSARDPYAAPEAPRGLAVASVIVGLIAMLLSPFLIGALIALVALPLAVLYLGRAREGRPGSAAQAADQRPSDDASVREGELR